MNSQKLNDLENFLAYLKKYKHIDSYRIDKKYKAAIVHVNSTNKLIDLMSYIGRLGAFFNIITTDEKRHKYRISIINYDEEWKKQVAFWA